MFILGNKCIYKRQISGKYGKGKSSSIKQAAIRFILDKTNEILINYVVRTNEIHIRGLMETN